MIYSHPHPQPLPDAATLFTRRRIRRQQAQTSVPDWVWGAGLGAIVLLFVGGFFLVSNVTGGSSGGSCDKALAPLGNATINAEAFVTEDAGLARVIDSLNRGDRAGAEAAFYGPVHNFTHAVDPPLREVDEGKARDLCGAVIQLENDLSARAGNATISGEVALVRSLLRDAAAILGYPRPE